LGVREVNRYSLLPRPGDEKYQRRNWPGLFPKCFQRKSQTFPEISQLNMSELRHIQRNKEGQGVCEKAHYSQEEIRAAITALRPEDKTALMRLAAKYSWRTGYEAKDLLQEALTRLWAGDRKWPKGVCMSAFFRGAMRSIASEWKKKRHHGEDDDVEIDGLWLKCDDQQDGVIGLIDGKREAAVIVALYEDDKIARKMVKAMLVGAKGQELRTLSGLTQTEYESKRRKIRRRFEKALLQNEGLRRWVHAIHNDG
jgi:DNA-directed RNA polymerase specialized sigma24 family protein